MKHDRDDESPAFENVVAWPLSAERYSLRLFVTGTTPRSVRAIRNIRAICEEQLHDTYDLEVIDIYQHPERIKPDQIVATPTLIKQEPLPVRRFIGDLSDRRRVLAGLGCVSKSEENGHDTG